MPGSHGGHYPAAPRLCHNTLFRRHPVRRTLGGLLRFRLPLSGSTIYGQITVIIIVCMIIVIFGGSTLERWVRDDYSLPDLEALSEKMAAIGSVVAAATPAERQEIVEIAGRGGWRLSLQPLSLAQRFTTSSADESFVQAATDWFFPPDDGSTPYGGWRTFLDGKRVISVKVDDATLLLLEQVPTGLLSSDALSFGSNYLVAMVTLILLFSIFAVWAITRPLRRIAAAAMKADISLGPAPFEERGSVEIVALARALNAMQRRISIMIEGRTRMLRGISHDLRTPLTRLRLRAERLQDEETRDAFLADILRLDHLLKESLGYLRDNYQREPSQRADLASLLQTVCDEFADMGHDVTYDGPPRLIAEFRPLAITRAVTNLCDNGIKFATRVDVGLRTIADEAVIEVADNGPGITAQYRERVMEPFFKIDSARGGSDTGFGLGLSIVSEIVEAHHGRFELLDRKPHGLIAAIRIPLARQ
jgi:signal transduction histidine kinase